MKKYTIKQIKNKTKELEPLYECISDLYLGNKSKLYFRCSEGHVYKTCWAKFISNRRCPICNGGIRYNINLIKIKLKKYGYECLSKTYVNSKSKLLVKCNNNHIYETTWNNFRTGNRCVECNKGVKHPKCIKKNNKKGIRKDLYKGGETVAWFDTYSHQLDWIEKVRRDPENKDYLQAKCTNSSCRTWFNPTRKEVIYRIRALDGKTNGYGRFYCSNKCKKECLIYRQQKYPKKFKPPNSVRSSQNEWAELVKERDKQCIKCGSTKDLTAHHIEGLNINPIESADIDVGITLCKKCHKKAHSKIGCRPIDLTAQKLC